MPLGRSRVKRLLSLIAWLGCNLLHLRLSNWLRINLHVELKELFYDRLLDGVLNSLLSVLLKGRSIHGISSSAIFSPAVIEGGASYLVNQLE